jgi:hypothetical protein
MVSCWSDSTWEQPCWLLKVTAPLTCWATIRVVSEAQTLAGRIST